MRLRLLVLLLTLSVPLDARAQDAILAEPPAPARPGERVRFNLEDGNLMDLVQMMIRLTGRRIVVTGPAREVRATVASQRDVTAGEAWQAFLAILEQNGLTLVRRGRIYYVEDNENVVRRPIPIVTDDDAAGGGERYLTWLHHVSHVPVSEAAQVLETFRSPSGRIVTHASTATLILVDTGANIGRMRRILEEIDVPRGDSHIWVERLHFADAEETAEQLMSVLGQEGEDPAPSAPTSSPRRPARATPQPEAGTTAIGGAAERDVYRVLSEPRTNALIIVATEVGYRRVIGLLRELDREDGARATVRVHRLQHGDAANVAATMQALLGLSAPQAGQGPAQGQSLGLQGRVRVEAHADLNALVVTATPADQRAVQDLIDELDAPPRQVFLEMVVMELTVDHSNALHVDLLGGLAELFGTSALGFFHAGVAPSADDLLNGLLFGVTGNDVSGLSLNGESVPEYGALIHALAGTTQADIMSTPHVLVLDNRQASINIGQSVPLQGSSVPGYNPLLTGTDDAAAAAAALTSSTSSGRRDTGTIVEVTPHVNDDGEIRLEIRAEDSRAADSAEGNLNATIFNQSVAETELIAHDGQTVVIGGLTRDQTELTRSGVPILSDIPIIGGLFGSTEERTIRRNLLFFVTPWIIRSPADLRAIVERRMRERRELIERQMAFSDDWSPPVDYSRTRGLVAEILTTLEQDDAMAAPAAPPPEHAVRPPIDAAE